MATFSPAELDYLTSERRLGRLATADADGHLHVVPVGIAARERQSRRTGRGGCSARLAQVIGRSRRTPHPRAAVSLKPRRFKAAAVPPESRQPSGSD